MARPPVPKPPQPIIRKVFFYRISRPDEVLKSLPGEIQRIMNLPFNEAGRYSADSDDNRFALWPESADYPLRLKFGKTRLKNLPLKERAGKISALDLAVDEGLLELCHIIIYENGFVAAEFNFEGPRISRLAEYIFEKRQQLEEKITFLPLFEKNILKLVQGMATIRLLELKGVPSAASLLSAADQSLGGAFNAMVQLGGTETVALELCGRNAPKTVLRTLVTKLASLTQERPAAVQDGLKILRIKGFNAAGRVDFVDLLEDHLVSTREFERLQENGKALNSDLAFEQIDQAYKEREPDLRDAITGQALVP